MGIAAPVFAPRTLRVIQGGFSIAQQFGGIRTIIGEERETYAELGEQLTYAGQPQRLAERVDKLLRDNPGCGTVEQIVDDCDEYIAPLPAEGALPEAPGADEAGAGGKS